MHLTDSKMEPGQRPTQTTRARCAFYPSLLECDKYPVGDGEEPQETMRRREGEVSFGAAEYWSVTIKTQVAHIRGHQHKYV